MSSPNAGSFQIINEMAREYESTGFSQRVCTRAKAVQLRLTLTALRKNDERWWQVKLQEDTKLNGEEVVVEVTMRPQDEWRLRKRNPELCTPVLPPQVKHTPVMDKRVELLFRQPSGEEWRDRWDYDLEFQRRVNAEGENAEDVLRHIEGKKAQVNDPAKRKEYFDQQAAIYRRETGQDPGELDPRLAANAPDLERDAAEPVMLKALAQSKKRETSQEMFDRLFPPKPLD